MFLKLPLCVAVSQRPHTDKTTLSVVLFFLKLYSCQLHHKQHRAGRQEQTYNNQTEGVFTIKTLEQCGFYPLETTGGALLEALTSAAVSAFRLQLIFQCLCVVSVRRQNSQTAHVDLIGSLIVHVNTRASLWRLTQSVRKENNNVISHTTQTLTKYCSRYL